MKTKGKTDAKLTYLNIIKLSAIYSIGRAKVIGILKRILYLQNGLAVSYYLRISYFSFLGHKVTLYGQGYGLRF